MKKTTKLLLTAMIGMLILTGCGNGSKKADEPASSGASSSPTAEAPKNDQKQVEISFFHWRNEDKAAYDEVIKKFELENPSIKVNMQIVPPDQFTANLKARLASGEKIADVLFVRPGDEFLSVAKAGGFTDLTQEPYVAQYLESTIGLGQLDGKQYVLPHTANLVAPIMYNKGIFEKLGLKVPTTWQEFLDVNEALKKAGYIPLANGAADRWPLSTGFDPLLFALVEQNFDGTIEEFAQAFVAGEIKADHKIFAELVAVYKELADKGYYPKSNLSTKYDDSIALFAQEKAGMVFGGSWSMASIRSQNSSIDLDFINIPLPSGPTGGGISVGAMMGVDAKSEYQEQAKTFVKFLSDPVNAAIVADKTGQVVLLKDLKVTNPDVVKVNDKMQTAHKYFRNVLPNLAYMDVLIDMVARVVSGDSVDNAVKEAQSKLDTLSKK